MRKSGHVLGGKPLRLALALIVLVAGVTAILAWPGSAPARGAGQVSAAADRHADYYGDRDAGARLSYRALAARSAKLLEFGYYNGTGMWHMCVPVICNTKNRDWGADTLTEQLYLRWKLDHDAGVLPLMRALTTTAHLWLPADFGSSDNATWDAVADIRLYQATGSKVALAKAQAALKWVDTTPGLGVGACPGIDYQWQHGARGQLKTIETTTNYIKAALLLYTITGKRSYLQAAITQYGQVRRYFLAKSAALYTSYLFDNGTRCKVLPGQYFASVNGNMIWAGSALAKATGHQHYLSEATATAHAVASKLSDGAGVFADLQADNDLVEPLVEAMYTLATVDHEQFARQWLLTNASAAGADVNAAGEFGRFFDGPPPTSLATAWQISGGIALIQAAAALDPAGRPADPGFWAKARWIADSQTLAGSRVRISFTGRAIAILGTIGANCCLFGHARVFIDGVQTTNRTGIWQDFSSPSRRQPDQVLFAWRWHTPGPHVITIKPGFYDREEGGSFFQMTGYLLVK